jgi:hypothetical protein
MSNILPKGKFSFNNVAKNLAHSSKKNDDKCIHYWITKHTIVKRDGRGQATKTVNQKCAKCNEERTEEKSYNDERIIYK